MPLTLQTTKYLVTLEVELLNDITPEELNWEKLELEPAESIKVKRVEEIDLY